MKSNGIFYLVLPASEIIHDCQPTDTLLATLGTSTKELIEMFLKAWSDFKCDDRIPMFGFDSMALRTNFDINVRLLVMDIIFEAMERRVEGQQIGPVSTEDRKAAERVMMSIWAALSESIFELFSELKVSDEQIGQMRFERWLGDDFMVSLPRRLTAMENDMRQRYEHELKLEQDRVDQLRANSPLCNHHSGRTHD